MNSMQSQRALSVSNTLASWPARAALAVIVSIVYGYSLAHSVSPALLALLPIGLLLGAALFMRPEIGVVVLLGVRWGFFSEAGVKFHQLPAITTLLSGLLLAALLLRRFG